MKLLATIVLMILSSAAAHGQAGLVFPVTPATPTDFVPRNVGTNVSGVAILTEPPVPKKIKVSFTAVSPLREWANSKGLSTRGSLIAFEAGDHSQSQKELTIIRDGKIRLLVEGQNNFNLIALSLLSKKDQEYIIGLVKARKEAAAGKK